MVDIEFGCNVSNMFDDSIEDTCDPFVLLNSKLKKTTVKDKKEVRKKDAKGKVGQLSGKAVEKNVAKTPAKVQVPNAPVVRQPVKEVKVSTPVPETKTTIESNAPKQQTKEQRDFKPFENESVRPRHDEESGPTEQSRQTEAGDRGFRRGRGSSGVSRNVQSNSMTFTRGGGGRFRGGGFRGPVHLRFEEVDDSANPRLPEDPVVWRGRGRPGSFGRFGDRRGERRQFERHSGSNRTGIRADEKRQGAGAHNWGRAESEVEKPAVAGENPNNLEDSIQQEDVDTQQADLTKSVVQSQPLEVAEAARRSPSPVEMSLDEYREQQRKLRVELSHQGRQAGEGEDPKRWGKHAQAFHKKPSEEFKYLQAESTKDDSETDEIDEDPVKQEKLRAQISVQSNLFKAVPINQGSRRETGGRRPRGQDFGSTRGANRGNRVNEDIREDNQRSRRFHQPPSMADFPELS